MSLLRCFLRAAMVGLSNSILRACERVTRHLRATADGALPRANAHFESTPRTPRVFSPDRCE